MGCSTRGRAAESAVRGGRLYKKMLVPLDGSELAEVVLPYAGELAGRLNLDAIVLHVCVPEEREFLPLHRAYVQQTANIVRGQANEARLESCKGKARLQPGGRLDGTRGELAVGHPAEEILRYADENDIDFILMATHGRSGIRRWAMGSVADKVLRAAKVPVWLVRAGVPEDIVHDQRLSRTMVVPLDGSELAESVFPHVEALAMQRGAGLVNIVLLSVCEPTILPWYYPETWPLNWRDHVDRCKQANERYLSRVEERFRNAGFNVRSEVLTGKPADQIIDYINKGSFTLIVMATHGRTGSRRWIYGSVADKLLHGVTIPVFLVRTHGEDSGKS